MGGGFLLHFTSSQFDFELQADTHDGGAVDPRHHRCSLPLRRERGHGGGGPGGPHRYYRGTFVVLIQIPACHKPLQGPGRTGQDRSPPNQQGFYQPPGPSDFQPGRRERWGGGDGEMEREVGGEVGRSFPGHSALIALTAQL